MEKSCIKSKTTMIQKIQQMKNTTDSIGASNSKELVTLTNKVEPLCGTSNSKCHNGDRRA